VREGNLYTKPPNGGEIDEDGYIVVNPAIAHLDKFKNKRAYVWFDTGFLAHINIDDLKNVFHVIGAEEDKQKVLRRYKKGAVLSGKKTAEVYMMKK